MTPPSRVGAFARPEGVIGWQTPLESRRTRLALDSAALVHETLRSTALCGATLVDLQAQSGSPPE